MFCYTVILPFMFLSLLDDTRDCNLGYGRLRSLTTCLFIVCTL